MEMVAAIVHQLTRNLTDEEVRNNPSFAPYFVDHTGDVLADLTEDMAADGAMGKGQH